MQREGESLWDRASSTLQEKARRACQRVRRTNLPGVVATGYGGSHEDVSTGLTKRGQLDDATKRGLEYMDKQTSSYTMFGKKFKAKDQVAEVSKFLVGLESLVAEARNVDTGSCMRTFDIADDMLPERVSPNGRYFAFSGPVPDDNGNDPAEMLQILDISDQAALSSTTSLVPLPDCCSARCVFSRNSKYIAITHDGSSMRGIINVYAETAGWKDPRQFDSGCGIQSSTLSSDGNFLAVINERDTIMIWNVHAPNNIPIFQRLVMYDPSTHPTMGRPLAVLRFSACNWYIGFYTSMGCFEVWHICSHQLLRKFDFIAYESLWFDELRPSFEIGQTCYISGTSGIRKFGPEFEDKLTYEEYGLSEDKRWIIKGSIKKLFIPLRYLGLEPIVLGSTVILYHTDGYILLSKLS